MRMSTAVAAGALALALLGAACANDDGGNAGSSGDATGGAVTGSTGSSGSSGGGAYGGGGYGSGGGMTGSTSTGGGSSVLTLTQVNYQFTPAKITVHQGDTITVSDTNPNTPHTFTVTDTDIDVSNDAMSSQDVTIDLAPGTYPFICRFHESQGMTGTLVVK
jgi:plastocyanin